MNNRQSQGSFLACFPWILAGALLAFFAWQIPAHLSAIKDSVLIAAAKDTPTLLEKSRASFTNGNWGSAAATARTAELLQLPGATDLLNEIKNGTSTDPRATRWGVTEEWISKWFPDSPTPNGTSTAPETKSTPKLWNNLLGEPVLELLVREASRNEVSRLLGYSHSPGVIAILATRNVEKAGRFVPANRPGGQTLDAVILLWGLLYQGERLDPALHKQIATLAQAAAKNNDLGDFEPVCLDLLSLGKRMDWGTLSALLSTCSNTADLAELSRLSRVGPDVFTISTALALFSGNTSATATYLRHHGQEGLLSLEYAAKQGHGALNLLLKSDLPLLHTKDRFHIGALTAPFILAAHEPAVLLKYALLLLGPILAFFGLERLMTLATATPGNYDVSKHPRSATLIRASLLGIIAGGILIAASEPFLLKPAEMTEFKITLGVPVLSSQGAGRVDIIKPTLAMDINTILSISFFLCLQVGMYLICLWKIRQVDRQQLPALVKLRLMENEENLFDGGLYVGIAGTATALVLQVLKVIEPNLLAAYSSNLFGIVCVALVKIRHVRPYKCALILRAQTDDPSQIK